VTMRPASSRRSVPSEAEVPAKIARQPKASSPKRPASDERN
jgi:hypothetical protein